MKPADFLVHYATQFGKVESDTTYYRAPDERLMRGGDEKTPGGFALSAEFPRAIVHAGEEAGGGRFDRIVIDNSERLARWTPLVRESSGSVPETLAYANNHYAGYGPATIRELAALVNRTP